MHDPHSYIVQKYGGTSVGNAERMLDVAEIVKASIVQHKIIVVLSAMSGAKKSDGTTSRLLSAADEVLAPNSTNYLTIIDQIEESHLSAIAEAVFGPESDEIKASVEKDVKQECQRLRSFLSAAEIIDEISPRSRDIIISTGEKLSARIFTAVLQSQGVPAVYVNLDRLITQTFEANQIDQGFYDYLVERLAKLMSSLPADSVPVVTGYFGPVPNGIVATIGRGYTDLTAALISVAVKAQELQIWKEVDGIFTADPRKAPKARLLASITPEEASELTYYGSEVIHPFTMEQVIRASIPIRIKNTFKPAGFGTVICPDGVSQLDLIRQHMSNSPRLSSTPRLKSPSRSMSNVDLLNLRAASPRTSFSNGHSSEEPGTPSGEGTFEFEGLLTSDRHPTAATIKDDVVVVNVHSNRKSVAHGFFAQIFATLDRHGITVDLISTSEVHVSMALNSSSNPHKLDLAIKDLRKIGTVDVLRDMAILSLVGKQMRHLVGIASKMFSTLAKHKINIEMISQGASEINISCVVAAKVANLALRAIHDECIIAAIESDGSAGAKVKAALGAPAPVEVGIAAMEKVAEEVAGKPL
ncbi:Aspartate/glutamate/uridylate kinase [Cladochytrium replicatum]|nr:Aspartate/glutamate/uridylate kinase [Cladochytrium replicatum]